jgi:uncharacterized damage-inducible protein DinB
MLIRDALLPEFDQETANTRKVLERAPMEKSDWRPHEKSWDVAQLADHLQGILRWAVSVMQTDSFDVASPEAEEFRPNPTRNRDELLARFDRNQGAARAALAQASNEDLIKPWSLKNGGQTIFSMPRVAALRAFVMNHSVHHRGQLCVYLRMNGVPVPALYGPSADEE